MCQCAFEINPRNPPVFLFTGLTREVKCLLIVQGETCGPHSPPLPHAPFLRPSPKTTTMGRSVQISILSSLLLRPKSHIFLRCAATSLQNVSIANQRVTRVRHFLLILNLGAPTLVLTNFLKRVDRYWKQVFCRDGRLCHQF